MEVYYIYKEFLTTTSGGPSVGFKLTNSCPMVKRREA